MFYIEIIFFASIALQILFFLFILLGIEKSNDRLTKKIAPEWQPISVIVCAHDELENLQSLVPLLLSQEHPDFEVIVVNDRSNDETYDWLLAETKKDTRLRMVHVDQIPRHVNGKKYGLTLGIRAASHEWLVFTDADCRPATNKWLSQLNSHLHNKVQFVLGYSPYMKRKGLLNTFIRFEALITAIQYLGFAAWKIPYMGVGRNLAYRKSVFMEHKGFNNIISITGGDDDLFVNQYCTKDNTEINLGKDALVYSIPKTTLSDYFHQKVRHLAVGKRYKTGHRILLGAVMITWIISVFLGIPLLFTSGYQPFIAGALALRVIAAMYMLHIAAKRFEDTFEIWAFLLLDIIYTIYYLTTGTAAMITKRIRWKN